MAQASRDWLERRLRAELCGCPDCAAPAVIRRSQIEPRERGQPSVPRLGVCCERLCGGRRRFGLILQPLLRGGPPYPEAECKSTGLIGASRRTTLKIADGCLEDSASRRRELMRSGGPWRIGGDVGEMAWGASLGVEVEKEPAPRGELATRW